MKIDQHNNYFIFASIGMPEAGMGASSLPSPANRGHPRRDAQTAQSLQHTKRKAELLASSAT
jgi:hypothetical protein